MDSTATNNGASSRSKWADQKVFTTGEAAEVCKVSQQTIIRCFDAGRLGGFRVPGSKFRRIPRAELIRFMQANDIPTSALETGGKRVLVVDDDAAIVELLRDTLGRDGRFSVRTAATGFDAGMLCESFKPHVVLLDFMLPDINGNLVCQRIRENPELHDTKIIIVSGVVKQEDVQKLMGAGADDFVKKPFNVQQLIERMGAMVGV
jgi:two-component system OmpR family response regulator